MVTVKSQVETLLASSVTVQRTVVVPGLNVTPSNDVPVPVVAPESVYSTVISVQLSVASTSQEVPLCV